MIKWKTIDGFENYEVSTDGRVRRVDTKRERKLVNNKGYKTIGLIKNGECKVFSIHRLVAQAFIPNPDNKDCVHHIDENRSNNNVSNLEWVTHIENINYSAYKISETLLKKKSGKSILCIELNKTFHSIHEAARQLNLKAGNITSCLHGRQKTTGGYSFRFN